MRQLTLSVLVPVYNEKFLVEKSLAGLFALNESPQLKKIQVIVVDDGSSDGTHEVLKKLSEELPGKSDKVEWIFKSHTKNQGKGKAIQTALSYASGEVSVIHDADLEYSPKDLARMVSVFCDQKADAVYGSRFLPHKYKKVLYYRHQLGNKALTFLSNCLTNLNLTDMETCYKMIKTDLFKSIPLESNDFRLEPEITIKLSKRKAIIYEVPIDYDGRTYEEGKKISWRDGVLAIIGMFKFSFSNKIDLSDPEGSEILESIGKADRFNKWMADTIKPYVGQKVLEIGAGVGNISKFLIPKSVYYATDVNPSYLQTLEAFGENKPFLSVARLDITAPSNFTPPAEGFDTAICLNVLEHLDDDLQALQNIHELLVLGGKAIILVPQGPKLYGSLDEALGHKRRYSVDEFRELALKAGFEIETIVLFNRFGTLGWFVNGKLMRKRSFSNFQVKILDILVPIVRGIDKFFPWPSLSVIGILKRS